jgi:chromosomal replication initiator protein
LEMKALWDNACVIMRSEMSEVTYSTWIAAALRPIGLADDRLYIEAVTDFYHQFVVPRYAVLIANALTEAASRSIRAEILTPKQAEEYRKGKSPAKVRGAVALNPKYTFESFVVGGSNRFAHAASLAVAESPADAYNPLFLYGGVGLGKTHLMHAIGHFILAQHPDINLQYITSESFTNEMISAIQTNRNAAFREKYRNVDVLLIDDIQFIAGRDSTQEEFFHTFNTLHAAGKQIIISSDKPPRDIPRLEERLRSRFEWGLIADIQKPDVETRIAILRKKAGDELMRVEDSVLQMIAERVENNIRELEGCLTRLVAYASLTHRTIDLSLAQEALREVFSRNEPRKITCDDIIACVAVSRGVTIEDLKGPRRSNEISAPRQIVMYLARELTDMSLPRIGEFLGGRDHTTIIHGYQKVADGIRNTPEMARLVDDLTRQLTGK